MSQPQTTDENAYVTEDALDTNAQIEALFLSLVHGTVTRLRGAERARVNSAAVKALQRVYKKYGRIFSPGPNTSTLPQETIDALMWALPPVPPPSEQVM